MNSTRGCTHLLTPVSAVLCILLHAAITMNADLHIGPAAYGLGSGVKVSPLANSRTATGIDMLHNGIVPVQAACVHSLQHPQILWTPCCSWYRSVVAAGAQSRMHADPPPLKCDKCCASHYTIPSCILIFIGSHLSLCPCLPFPCPYSSVLHPVLLLPGVSPDKEALHLPPSCVSV
jgi:hypothetical protein